MKRNSTRATVAALVVVAVASVLALATTAERALAGQYHVYGCRTPDEQPAPVDGWSKSTTPASTASVVAEDTCASGGKLVAGLRNTVAHEVGTLSMWTLSVPPSEVLKGLTLWRFGDTEGGSGTNATYQFVVAGPTQFESFTQGECLHTSGCNSIGEPTSPLGPGNLLAIPAANLGEHLYVTAACGGLPGYSCPEGKGDPDGYSAVVYVYAADLLLEDDTQPTVLAGSIDGELATASSLSGEASLVFSAEDEGSGISRAIVSLDGAVVGETQLDGNGGRCVNTGQSADGLPSYLYLQPCAHSVGAAVQLDTTSIPNGSHRLTVAVQDAAGNSTTVIDRQVEIANATLRQAVAPETSPSTSLVPTSGVAKGASNGVPASPAALLTVRWARGSGSVLAGRWGRSAAIAGKLTTSSGAPIASAKLELVAVAASQGATSTPVATVSTDADGRFSVGLSPYSRSERIAVLYRAHDGDPVPAASGGLELVVPASVVLRIAPKVSKLGGTIRFGGVVNGGPMPQGGKQLALQARLPGPVVYRFRALSPHEADFPFARGASNVVSVRER